MYHFSNALPGLVGWRPRIIDRLAHSWDTAQVDCRALSDLLETPHPRATWQYKAKCQGINSITVFLFSVLEKKFT